MLMKVTYVRQATISVKLTASADFACYQHQDSSSVLKFKAISSQELQLTAIALHCIVPYKTGLSVTKL
jgi:hypothetical protein